MILKKVITQTLLLMRDLSYQRQDMALTDEQTKERLRIVGELSDISHNIPEILCEHPNEFLIHLFIIKLKNFLRTYPQYDGYFEHCGLPEND